MDRGIVRWTEGQADRWRDDERGALRDYCKEGERSGRGIDRQPDKLTDRQTDARTNR